jgi:hypothetical protein
MLYKMHLETHHLEPKTARPVVAGVKHPYTKAEKAAVVARGERRIGEQHFYGGGN